MDDELFREVKIVKDMTVDSGLGMGKKEFLVGSLLVIAIFGGIAALTVHGALGDVPARAQAQTFTGYIKFTLFYMSIFVGFMIGWIFSFQLLSVEKEEKMFGTLLASPLRISLIYLGKIAGFIILFLPVYYIAMSVLSFTTLGVGKMFFENLPPLNLSLIYLINAGFIGPLFGIGACCTISFAQLWSKNPRTPSMLILFIGIGFMMTAQLVRGYLQMNLLASSILTIVALGSIAIPIGLIYKGYITPERVISTT